MAEKNLANILSRRFLHEILDERKRRRRREKGNVQSRYVDVTIFRWQLKEFGGRFFEMRSTYIRVFYRVMRAVLA